MSSTQVKSEVVDQLQELNNSLVGRLEELKQQDEVDLEIDEIDLDKSLMDIPQLHAKYLSTFTDETIKMKELYGFREKIKLERWKYWQGKQTDKYYAENGIVHEKILKSDVDKYLAADDKMVLVNDITSTQKAIVDYLERVIKEITNRGFHIKSIIDWRRFTSGS